MEHLPTPLDNQPSPLARAATYALVPIVLVLALPILLLLVLFLYLAALVHGGRVFVYFISGREERAESEAPKPHFLQLQDQNMALPDESASSEPTRKLQ
jgi:hypothetical protein